MGREPIGRGRSGRVRRGIGLGEDSSCGCSGLVEGTVGTVDVDVVAEGEVGALDKGWRIGTVELAVMAIRPVTYPTSLSSNWETPTVRESPIGNR